MHSLMHLYLFNIADILVELFVTLHARGLDGQLGQLVAASLGLNGRTSSVQIKIAWCQTCRHCSCLAMQ